MVKSRIIPVLLLKNGRCVKGRQFKDYRDTGAPISAARIYNAQRVDELVFLDILATVEEREILLPIIAQIAEECFMPLCIGGGLRSIEDIKIILNSGADKVSINTAAVENPGFIREASEYFGKANIVVSIDYKTNNQGNREVYSRGGTKPSGKGPLAWAMEAAALGAGEIILTSIDREGMMSGYDLELLREVSGALSIPVIANGGAGTLKHLFEGIVIGGASGVAAASIFNFTDQNPIKARLFLKNEGINVRI